MLEVKQNTAQIHDTDIHQRYTTAVLPLFDHLPDVQRKILERSNEGYTIVGYKGTSKQLADSFIKYGVNIKFSAGDVSGTSHGDGVYLTPNFDIAKDFSELTVRREIASSNRKELLTPPEPLDFDSSDVDASKEYMRLLASHQNACSTFYASDECQKDMYFLIFFVKDFFNLNGKELTQEEPYTTSLDGTYDYIEGALLGPHQWEIKFSKHEDIYAKINILPISYTFLLAEGKTLPHLPDGTTNMRNLASVQTGQYLLAEHAKSALRETKFSK